jgi:hypothetical protein
MARRARARTFTRRPCSWSYAVPPSTAIPPSSICICAPSSQLFARAPKCPPPHMLLTLRDPDAHCCLRVCFARFCCLMAAAGVQPVIGGSARKKLGVIRAGTKRSAHKNRKCCFLFQISLLTLFWYYRRVSAACCNRSTCSPPQSS